MRDLGLMGESTFSLWCADAGLVPNGSQIDKTGWDFFVEFPFGSKVSTHEIHRSAFECKVQVKATDKNERKLSITLSNLRRLITAQMPAFFVFIEFDGKECAQRAFVVHVDEDLISKVLKRLHQVDQSESNNNFNKRKMTIHYDDTHILTNPSGQSLKERLLTHIGDGIEDYISRKKAHLESTGYENGFAQMTFTTNGEENLKTLIDVSLGIEKQVDVAKFKGVDTRFGIQNRSPFVDSEGGKLEMPNVKPTANGMIKFKEDKLSAGLTFASKLYNSPFNVLVPDNLKKMRVEGDFFDLTFNPYTGYASYYFSIGEAVRLEVKQFRNAIKLLNILGSSGKKIFAEFIFESLPKLEFLVGCSKHDFDFSEELKTLDCAVDILSDFEIFESVDISLEEISRQASQIDQMHSMTRPSQNIFKVEFGIEGDGYDPVKPTACIFLVTAPVGSHIVGAILVLTGTVEVIEDGRFRLISDGVIIEQRIVSERDTIISNEDLASAVEQIEKKYESEYSIVTMFDKSANQ